MSWLCTRSHVQRYKGRYFNPRAEVWVYRNLNMSDGPWYSIMQGNRVVGHSRFLTLLPARFVVQEGGRQRALKDGVKNVHAFAVGVIRYGEHWYDDTRTPRHLSYRAGYDLQRGHFWVDYTSPWLTGKNGPETHTLRMGMTRSAVACFASDGLSVDSPSTFPVADYQLQVAAGCLC